MNAIIFLATQAGRQAGRQMIDALSDGQLLFTFVKYR